MSKGRHIRSNFLKNANGTQVCGPQVCVPVFLCVYLHILQEGWLFDDIAPA